MVGSSRGAAVGLGVVLLLSAGRVTGEEIPFDSERWLVQGWQVVDHLGWKVLAGTAFLPDATVYRVQSVTRLQ